ncbi:MAG: hypothetical protein IIX27_02730 [Ruminococcus sp.]|nr:hypothetical protein [Ruminococcus sp.]
MSQFRDLMQKYVNLEYNELLAIGKKALGEAYPVLKNLLPDQKDSAVYVVLTILLGAVGADGTLSAKERQFMKDLLDLDDAAIDNFIKLYTGKEEETVRSIVKLVDGDTKINVITIVTCIVACDETITVDELSFVESLLGI